MQKISSDKAERRARHAWYLYDFGNSAYAAVILLAVFSPYFKDVVVGNGAEGTRLWGIAVGIAIYVSKDRDVLVLPERVQQGELVGLVVLAIVGWLLYRAGAKAKPALGNAEPGPM